MKELLLFSTMLVSIETVIPIRTANTIYLMVTLAIHAFEDVRTRLSFFGSCSICFLVFHAIPCFLSVMFSNVSSIALGAPAGMRTTTECYMAPFLAVLTLWNTQVHICITNDHNKLSNIKTMIDNVLHQRTALGISDTSDLGDTLMTHSFEANMTSLNKCISLRMPLI